MVIKIITFSSLVEKTLQTNLNAGDKIKAIGGFEAAVSIYSLGQMLWPSKDPGDFPSDIQGETTKCWINHSKPNTERLILPHGKSGEKTIHFNNVYCVWKQDWVKSTTTATSIN